MPWYAFLQDEASLAVLLIFGLPVVAIVTSGVVTIFKAAIRHRERMAMIEQGIHPDAPQPPEDTGTAPEGAQAADPNRCGGPRGELRPDP